MTNKHFGAKMGQMFFKICQTIHENADDLVKENNELAEHIRQTAKILQRRSQQDGLDLGESQIFLDEILQSKS